MIRNKRVCTYMVFETRVCRKWWKKTECRNGGKTQGERIEMHEGKKQAEPNGMYIL